MKRSVSSVLLLLLLVAQLPIQLAAHAQGAPQVEVRSQYVLNTYGYAVINEMVRFTNNGTSPLQVPDHVTVGFGNLSSMIATYNFTGRGFSQLSANSVGGPFTVGGGQSIAAGSSANFTLSVLLNNVVFSAKNGSLEALLLTRPSLSVQAGTLLQVVKMPDSTTLASPPLGLTQSGTESNVTYSATQKNVTLQDAQTEVRAVKGSAAQDFHPLRAYHASRTLSVGAVGAPFVIDSISFKNLGTTTLSNLVVAPLTTSKGQVTVVPAAEPRLLSPATVALANYGIELSNSAIGYPVPAGANYTITYQYPLDHKYYTVAGGLVTVNLPTSPPIAAFIGSYAISISVPTGVKVVRGPPQAFADVNPWQNGEATMAYGLSVGWAVAAGIPAASAVFVLLLVGLFVSKTTLTEEEETEEESSTERATAMIKAFDEKTGLINGLWPEVASADPNVLDKEYFDEIRGRLDAFRSRALQRLNEVKHNSTTQKFFDLLNQIHTTEREVDRAAKDKLNLYEQYYTRRMRKEVFGRLLPQYTKRLERALNQLSDELHVVQREAKLL